MRLPFNGNYPITQKFGVNPQDYAQFGMIGHNGIDYGLPLNTSVVAAEDGRVAVLSDPGGFGNYIQLVGAHQTIYAHLARAMVSSGVSVKAGDLIAYSGNTGNSSGPHLHFGVKPLKPDNTNGFLGAIDPQPLLTGGGDMVITQVMFNYIWRGFFDAEPPAAESKYWVGRSNAEELEKYLAGLYQQNEGRRYKANHYDEQAIQLAGAKSQVTSQAATITSLNGQISQLQSELEAAKTDTPLLETPAKALGDYSTDEILSEVARRIWATIK